VEPYKFEPLTKEQQVKWRNELKELYEKDLHESHCHDLTSDRLCNIKLNSKRKEMLLDDPVLVTAPHYEKLQKLLDSELY